METVLLNDNNKIPVICYGSNIVSYDSNNKFKVILKIIKKILTLKFKELKKDFSILRIMNEMKENDINAIDTSRAYGLSEKLIGKKIKNDRDRYYIITKISNSDQYNGTIEQAVLDSLNKMNTNYIDLLLLHWPVPEKYVDTWKKMEELKDKGICRSIGVCNCNKKHLEEIEKIAKYMPAVNEIECHPLFTQNELRKYCNKNNIKILAYTSTARMDDRLYKTCLVPIAKKYNKTVAQIILRWHYQIKNIPIFNTTIPKRYKENIDIFDFSLTDDEIESISKININSRLRYDPENCDFRQL